MPRSQVVSMSWPCPQVAPGITLAACDWTAAALPPQLAPPYRAGLVLAADCVWLEELVEPFVRTLERVAGPSTQVRRVL